MATIEQLSKALVNADRAGDAQAAKTLANEIIRMRAASAGAGSEPESEQSQNLRSELSGMSNKLGDASIDSLAQARYDALPAWQKPLVAAGDIADLAATGATFGLGNKAAAAARAAFTDKTYAEELAAMEKQTQDARDRARGAGVAAEIGGSFLLPVGAARAGLSPTANAINAGRGLGRVSAASALEGAGYGALSGAGASDGTLEGMREGAGYGAIGGLAIGGAMPLAMKAGSAAARKALSPFLTNPERANAANRLAQEGVETTAGQRTGNDRLRYAESEIGGRKARDVVDRQAEQFTRAALKRAGIDASRATPDVIDDGFRAIGQKFDDLAARNNLSPDKKIASDLGAVWKEYASLTPENARAPVVMDMIFDIGNRLKLGDLDGAAYQSARSRLDRLARASSRDPQLQDALYGLRNALDDGMERSILRTNPKDVKGWREARKLYRNMLTLERAATGAGEDAAQGIISPAALKNATVTTQGRRNYARGSGDFAELARSGSAVMGKMPNSGTAGRLNAQNLGIGLAGILGAGAGTTTGDPMNAGLGALAGLAAPRMAGAVLMNPAVQKYLGNQLAGGLAMSPQTKAMIYSLLNAESSGVSPAVGRAIAGP